MKYLLLTVIFGFGLIMGLFFVSTKQTGPSPKSEKIPVEITKEVNYKANFAIFTNGTLRDFSSSRYHNLSKDVFIQADNPNIVQVKKEGITWDDFFKTLPMKLSKDCLVTGTKQTFCTDDNKTLRFFLNGKEDKNVLDKEIGNGDKFLVTYGS